MAALRRVGGAALTVALGVLVAEVVVRVALHAPGLAERLPCTVGRDALCGLRTLLHARGLNDHAWDATRGWRNLHTEAGRGRVDADGHRVHPDPGAGTPDRPVIALIGDSFTYGDEVDDDVTFAARLAALRPDLRVVNLGVPGYGHDQILLDLREEGPRLAPDVVVLGWVARDVERNGLRVTSAPKPWFEPDGDGLALRGVPVPRPTEAARALTRSWWTLAVARGVVEALREPVAARAALDVVSGRLLDAIAAEAAAEGAALIVVRLPTRSSEIPDGPGHVWAPAHAVYDRWCAVAGAPCLDLLPTFRAAWDAGVDTSLGGHWNADGHALVADALAAAIPREPPPAP